MFPLGSGGRVMQLKVPIDTGGGEPVVLLHGYAMRPATYSGLVKLLARRCRVIVPDLFAMRGRWSCSRVLDSFTSTLDHLGLDRVSIIGHSFGGGIELGFASRFPERDRRARFLGHVGCVTRIGGSPKRRYGIPSGYANGDTQGYFSFRQELDRASPPAGRRCDVGIREWARRPGRGCRQRTDTQLCPLGQSRLGALAV